MVDGENVETRDIGRSQAADIDYRAVELIRDRFVFDKATGRFFLLSKEGAWILRAIMRGQSTPDIEADLMDHYGISRGTAMRDLEQFKLRLARLGLTAEPKET